MCEYRAIAHSSEDPNKGHFGDNIDRPVWRDCALFGRSQCFCYSKVVLGSHAISLVEKCSIPCLFLGRPFTRRTTVHVHTHIIYLSRSIAQSLIYTAQDVPKLVGGGRPNHHSSTFNHHSSYNVVLLSTKSAKILNLM